MHKCGRLQTVVNRLRNRRRALWGTAPSTCQSEAKLYENPTYHREPLREFEVHRELGARVPDDVPCTLKRRELIRDGCCIVFYCALQLARGQLRVGGFRGRKLERGIWVRGRELLMRDTRIEAGAVQCGRI